MYSDTQAAQPISAAERRIMANPERYQDAMEDLVAYFGRSDAPLRAVVDFLRGATQMQQHTARLRRDELPKFAAKIGRPKKQPSRAKEP